VFFENLDTYCKNNPKVLRTLLNEIDELKIQNRIIVLAAASKLHGLSECNIESSKFENIFQIVMLNYNKRKELFLYYLTNMQCDVTLDVDILIKTTEGMNAKQIKRVINCSERKAELQNRCKVTMQDICYALLTTNPNWSKTASVASSNKPLLCTQIAKRSSANANVSRSHSTRTNIQAVNSFFRPNKCGKFPLYKVPKPPNINVRGV
jgi:SpoVK/Ycf46/Vps4 family AAA+-type ATPase